MEREPPDAGDALRTLKEIDVELAYLALLTVEGLKPLSRWEKPLDSRGIEALERLGLQTTQVDRTVATGAHIVETLLATTPAFPRIYARRFGGRPVDKTAETTRMEGFLFGYPPCCIERYIEHPYAPNRLPAETQKTLFHWACEDCKVTGLLVPAYARIFQRLQEA